MKRLLRHHIWISLAIVFLLLLAACGGGGDEAVQDTSDTDTGAVDEATDSEAIDDGGIDATGSEGDSGGLPATPDSGSKVNVTRASPNPIAAAATAVATPIPPTNRTGSQETADSRQMDIVLLLDATGSMTEELMTLQTGLDDIASRLDSLPDTITLRHGFVAYRDLAKTDASQIFGLTEDWALFAANLAAITAVGGGDYAEDLNGGLYRAVTEMEWQPNVTRLLILLGDAPPHLDVSEAVPYSDTILLAAEQNITIFTIGSDGLNEQGEAIYQQIAQSSNGRFLFIANKPENTQTAATAIYPMANLATVIVEIVLEVLNEAP